MHDFHKHREEDNHAHGEYNIKTMIKNITMNSMSMSINIMKKL